MASGDSIRIVGARQHNLRNLDVEIPKGKLVVITGVSGSGKSSLAFHTLFAEGQRRYVESLSAYARQFLDRLDKPEVDRIEGLSPAIAIEQRTSAPNPRSTIATATEIYDYLRVLYAAGGVPHDPTTGERVTRQTTPEIADVILAMPGGSRLLVLAPLVRGVAGDHRGLLERVARQGFVRVRVNGGIELLEDLEGLDRNNPVDIELVVDRLVLKDGIRGRLVESLESALKWGGGDVWIAEAGADAAPSPPQVFTTRFTNPATGFTLPELTPKHFSFNGHLGACPDCQGLGSLLEPDAELFVPDPEKSLANGAVKTWWSRNKKLRVMHDRAIVALANHFGVTRDAPFRGLPRRFKDALFEGTGEEAIATGWKTGANTRSVAKPFEGLLEQARRLHETSKSESTRRNVRKFMAPQSCLACEGRRLRPEVLAVTLASQAEGLPDELGIHQFCALSIRDAHAWIEGLQLRGAAAKACGEVVEEIRKRLRFLNEVGLGYLTMDRGSATLSGGEAQRIRLATQIGGGLTGVIYVLDEPSIGLHQSDNARLIGTLKELRDIGNSVIVVEHDSEMMEAADHILDLGPGAGEAGGELVAAGTLAEIRAIKESATGRYLSGARVIGSKKSRMSPPPLPPDWREASENAVLDTGWIAVHGAREHNLQGIDVPIPLGLLTCVTGVSGSGKSTLVDRIFRRVLFRKFFRAKDRPGAHDRISGLAQLDKAVVIDQAPIGRSPRSNPATYVGVFTPIRELFAALPAAKVRGYDAGRFSFNVAGGRCETCGGDGSIKIDMHFLSDVYVTCESCQGQRYNPETLEVTFKGRNIAEVLAMTVEEAARFFVRVPQIYDRLRKLQDVGLGYLRLGQAGTTLSGGEAQRVKLAAELSKKATGRTLYLLDEPTTGLHFSDIETLMAALFRIRDSGNTLVVIEHNLDVIRSADWVVDLGPGGGSEGGQLVAMGSPEEIAACKESETGRYL